MRACEFRRRAIEFRTLATEFRTFAGEFLRGARRPPLAARE
jgi:hypothetical protein